MVRVTDHFLGCIAFICVEDPGQNRPEPRGTAFAVSVSESDRPDVAHCYLITARHNLELAQSDRIFVRVNTEGGFRDILTDRSQWQKHDSADVACLLFGGEQLDQIPLPISSARTFRIILDSRKTARIFLYGWGQSYFLSVYSFSSPAEAGIFPLLGSVMYHACQPNLFHSLSVMELIHLSRWHILRNVGRGADIAGLPRSASSIGHTKEHLCST